MKNQSTSVKSVNYDQEIKNWAEEDVLQLANHFHKLNGTQYERTHDFAFRAEDNAEELKRFNTVKETMKSLKIYLALDENDKMKHTFFPVLKVIDGDGKEHSFKLYPVLERKVDHGESEVVPQVFKNMICKNWDEVDIHLIDDLFTARQKIEKQPEITVRVEYYDICKEIIDTEIKPIDTITGITLYSGIDMNKFADKYQISFTPVLGLKRENSKTPNPIMGLKGVVEFSKGEVLIEYSSPCPPTC